MPEEQDQQPKPTPKRPTKPTPKVPPLRKPTDLQPATKARNGETPIGKDQ